MTNYDILAFNKEMSADLVTSKIGLHCHEEDEFGELNVKVDIEYNYIETVSMLSYNNRVFCKFY